MKLSNFVKVAAVGALLYGAYKLGESKGKSSSNEDQDSTNGESNGESLQSKVEGWKGKVLDSIKSEMERKK